MIIAILGRQPKIGLAELESLFGADAVQPIGAHAALLAGDPSDPARLGSVLKLATPLAELPTTNWPQLVDHLKQHLPDYLPSQDGKL